MQTTAAATKTESTFRLEYSVTREITATPATIWRLLTDAGRFPSWNTTVTSIEGEIALGHRLTLHVPLAPGRAFRPRVTAFEPESRMVWSDGMAPMFKGTRTFSLTPSSGGTTVFTMVEEFKGVMLPMIKGTLPDFRAAFDQYAADLERAAESS
ncbi:MAG: SRPBCC domain-containing protein [Deltaproteobacteria bacterium]|nr:SRPBCC domain-containing protein [Nannocystaceae bacterium]